VAGSDAPAPRRFWKVPWLSVAGGVLLVGSLLPWVRTTYVTFGVTRIVRHGVALAGGVYLLALGLALLGLGILANRSGRSWPRSLAAWGSVVIGLLSGLVLAGEWKTLHRPLPFEPNTYVHQDVLWGFWLCVAGALMAVGAGALSLVRSSETRRIDLAALHRDLTSLRAAATRSKLWRARGPALLARGLGLLGSVALISSSGLSRTSAALAGLGVGVFLLGTYVIGRRTGEP
jgi:hypothetical protein